MKLILCVIHWCCWFWFYIPFSSFERVLVWAGLSMLHLKMIISLVLATIHSNITLESDLDGRWQSQRYQMVQICLPVGSDQLPYKQHKQYLPYIVKVCSHIPSQLV